VIVNELAAETFTMKSAFVVPMFPSITDVSWIERVGSCACAADERRVPNARTKKDRGDILIESIRWNAASQHPLDREPAEDLDEEPLQEADLRLVVVSNLPLTGELDPLEPAVRGQDD